ncbi:ATP-dependent carboxylate-amine ligase [Streptosporangiaceae bacterium NEAU-GS5]|nr:ATP-dependent carboxylate-amine ligase [Streptosporangiaceae bacterium NEAU-GS5]
MLMIISDPADASAALVLPKLKERGVETLWWDESALAAETTLTIGLDGAAVRQTLTHEGRAYDLAEVTAVWHRRPRRPKATAVGDETQRAYADLVTRATLEGAYALMTDRWMPARPQDAKRIDYKALHLAMAAERGFAVPGTVFTNDPAELVPAWHRAGGRLICKTPEKLPFELDGEARHMYTTRVERRHLAGRHRVRHAPVMLQPNVPKECELRVTVVGDRVFAAEIDSQSSRLTAQDWRHYEDQGVAYRPHDLPPQVARRCVELVRALGLSFGAIDLIRTPAGDYVFLELNVNGQWAFVEIFAGLPISDAIADWLTAKETHR